MTLATAATTVANAPCWGAGYGAGYSNHYTNDGVRSLQDFTSATVNPNWNETIAKPMQISHTLSGDFVGWGTARGEGTDAANAISNCPDNYDPHWHVYIDGYSFGKYFCRQNYGDIPGTATDELFTLRYGDCNGNDRWRVFLNGVRESCQAIDATSATRVNVGGEVYGDVSIILKIDQHFDDLRYHTLSGLWHAWNYGAYTYCENNGYRIRFLASDNIWAELEP